MFVHNSKFLKFYIKKKTAPVAVGFSATLIIRRLLTLVICDSWNPSLFASFRFLVVFSVICDCCNPSLFVSCFLSGGVTYELSGHNSTAITAFTILLFFHLLILTS